MIISHKKKFVFLHCRKTAGTFISYLLYEFLENNDLIIGSLEDIYKKKKINIFNHINIIEPSNLFLLIKTFLTTIKYKKNFGFLLNEFYKKKYSRIYANPAHMDISKIRQNFKETDKYFTFCFVRNPYDFEVSDYLWRIKINTKYKNMKFKEYLNSILFSTSLFLINDKSTAPFDFGYSATASSFDLHIELYLTTNAFLINSSCFKLKKFLLISFNSLEN